MECLNVVMRSPAMHANYVALIPSLKTGFIRWLFDVGADNLRAVSTILSEKPYSAAFVMESANMDDFQDFALDGNFFGLFSTALDNTSLFELELIASYDPESVLEFISFL